MGRSSAVSATLANSRNSRAVITRKHFRRLREAPSRESSGHTVREKNGLRFEYSQAPNGIEVAAERGGQRSEALLEWAFGSGVRGITPVGSIEGHYFEHRISWYTDGDRAALTMGHKTDPPSDIVSALGMKQSAETIFQCFNCHGTGSKTGPDVSELRPGIQCERCHGPGEAHVRAPSAKSIYNPGRLSPSALVEACGQCHRLTPPEVDDRESIRFAPVGLTASRCFRQSGKLSCLTCHDPHSDVNRDAAYYVNKCVECHSGTTPAVNCRRAARANCLPCHMAKSNTAPFLTFTDHRIRVSHLLASQTYQVSGDPAKAVSEAQSEISSNPSSLAGYLQLGQIFLEYNTPEPAVEIFSKALPDRTGLSARPPRRGTGAQRHSALRYSGEGVEPVPQAESTNGRGLRWTGRFVY